MKIWAGIIVGYVLGAFVTFATVSIPTPEITYATPSIAAPEDITGLTEVHAFDSTISGVLMVGRATQYPSAHKVQEGDASVISVDLYGRVYCVPESK